MKINLNLLIYSSILVIFLSGIAQLSYSATIILTSDKQLSDLLDPNKKIDLSTGRTKYFASLREICEQAKKQGDKVLTIAFDEFFRQYREQAGTERKLTPDMDEYIDKIKVIGDFAAKYGMGIGLSLLSPLELGPAFKKNTGQSGRWLHYKVGVRDPETGKFSVQLWKQLYWTNNKGKFAIKLTRVKAFAFKETPLQYSPFKLVRPEDIIELKGNIDLDEYGISKIKPHGALWEKETAPNADELFVETQRVTVSSKGSDELKGYDRVMIVLEYETPEMDYFSPDALPFLKNLMKKYHDKGINLVSLYSDEMHIQQDWYYFNHHDDGQFCLRYHTPSFSNAFSEKFGQAFDEKNMLYFAYGMQSVENSAWASANSQYVLGDSPEAIQQTFLLRNRYYSFLNNQVVDLFNNAKKYAESLFGRELEASAHASWAESPTIDLWNTEKLKQAAYQYEYTPNFVWSNTVQQAAAACYDYFKWGEYLQPTGNDFAECGWLDRNYYGAAMAASIGVINKYPDAYAAFWGMPEEVGRRKTAINAAFGDRTSNSIELITGHVHRDVDVLILYPMELVAAEERFGSWMTQYAYANYITADKLLEMAKITADGHIKIADKTYSTLVTLYEPLPADELIDFMQKFTVSGGKLVWFGPPALINKDGKLCREKWEQLMNVKYNYSIYQGEIAAGKKVEFRNQFRDIPSQTILTDFIVDRIYPIVPINGAEILAECDGQKVGVGSKSGSGSVYFFGFRPRDDQAASLGYETRTLFEILSAVGAYPPTGKFSPISNNMKNQMNDNTEYVSRTTDYLTTRFPNGTTVVVRHYRTHRENWPAGFSRDVELDNRLLSENPLPTDTLILDNFKVNGHLINFRGKLITAFRPDPKGGLAAFEGHNCKQIKINGVDYLFSENPFETIVFAPENEQKSSYSLILNGKGKIILPLSLSSSSKWKLLSPDHKKIAYNLTKNTLELNVTPDISGKWLKLTRE